MKEIVRMTEFVEELSAVWFPIARELGMVPTTAGRDGAAALTGTPRILASGCAAIINLDLKNHGCRRGL